MQQWHEVNGIPRWEYEPNLDFDEVSTIHINDLRKFDCGFKDGEYGLQPYPSALFDLAWYCAGYILGIIRLVSLTLKVKQFSSILCILFEGEDRDENEKLPKIVENSEWIEF